MEIQITFDSQDVMQKVCGAGDRNLPYLELLTGSEIVERGNILTVTASQNETGDQAQALIERLKAASRSREAITEAEIFMEWQSLRNGETMPLGWTGPESDTPTISVHGRLVYPKSPAQEAYIRLMDSDQIVFATGPAGTGKTFLSVTHALSLLLSGKRRKLVITRPVVEAGESLGFLPGDLNQKINPYLRPLYDAMEAVISPTAVRKLEENGSIEVAPLAYMRGRTLDNAFIILDEAQNTTPEQMKMFLTRLGFGSRAVITGDTTQKDLAPGAPSGLDIAERVLKNIDGIRFVTLTSRDVVRHPLVQQIVKAYEDYDRKNAAKQKREHEQNHSEYRNRKRR